MILNNFIKTTLIEICRGVKEANREIKTEDNKSSFALKNSNWFVDKINGCISFDVLVESRGSEVKLADPKSKSSDIVHRIKFNVTQLNPVS